MEREPSHVRVADIARVFEHRLEVESFARCFGDLFTGYGVDEVGEFSGTFDPLSAGITFEPVHAEKFKGMTRSTIAWERLDVPGRETAALVSLHSGWRLSGLAEFAGHRIEYEVRCGVDWITESATVVSQGVDVELLRNSAGEWSVNGSKVWEVTGCDDVDFEFSPCTNTLPVRRLSLAIGRSSIVRAAWLRFPSFALEPFEQRYTRTGQMTYRFESSDGEFTRELTVDDAGLVIDYPGLWKARG